MIPQDANAHVRLASPAGAPPQANGDPNSVVYLAFTSGSTGIPKGVMHSDNTLLATARAIVNDWHLDDTTVTYSLSPFGHNLGFGTLITSLVCGGEFVIHDLPRGQSVIDRIAATGTTYLVGVPTHAIDLLEELRSRGGKGLERVKGFRISAAAVPGPVVEELLRFNVLPQCGYGMTETCAHQYTLPTDDHRLIIETSGKACPSYDLRIWDADDRDRELAARADRRTRRARRKPHARLFRRPGKHGELLQRPRLFHDRRSRLARR